MLRRFLSQPSRAYRNFQLVFLPLALNFLIPGVSYLVAPEIALEQFRRLGEALGGGVYPVAEASIIWRVLAGTNVITLGMMCVMLMADLRRFYPVLWPLSFMKGTTALVFLAFFFLVLPSPIFLGAFLLDGVSTALFIVFSSRAHRDIAGRPDEELVPRPLSARWSGPLLPAAAGEASTRA
jgi:hypothetical protein